MSPVPSRPPLIKIRKWASENEMFTPKDTPASG